MNQMNQMVIEGTVTKSEYIEKGSHILTLSNLENKRYYRGNDGTIKEEVNEIKVEAYGQTMRNSFVSQWNANAKFGKIPCRVIGRLKTVDWITDGKRSKEVRLVAEHIDFPSVTA